MKIREVPKCFICGKPNMEAVYRKQAPHESPIYGDLFLRWKPIEHECDEIKKAEFEKSIKAHNKEVKK